MSTRDEIEQAINDLADNAHAIGWNHRHADKTQPSVDHVMALIDAAVCPPAPGEVTETMVQAGVTALMSSAIACEMRLPETDKERREVVAWIYREMLAAAAPGER